MSAQSSSPSIVWFRRDLRLGDHLALQAAADGGEVAGLFVLDPELLKTDSLRTRFMLGCLSELNDTMDASLWTMPGNPAEVVPALARRLGARRVFVTKDFAPYGRRRDVAVGDALLADGRELVEVDSPYAVAPGIVRNGTGGPYRVFTPFFKAWQGVGWQRPADIPPVSWLRPERQPQTPYVVDGLPAWALPGEGAAGEALDRFIEVNLEGYAANRNDPGRDSTSRLSPYLRFGCIHPRTILARLGDDNDHDRFRAELAWREFYADVLFHQPESSWTTMQPKMRAMRSDTDAAARERFAAWCQGRTGFPLVDAGMRQLVAEGYMHNRVRMVAASFLIKDLHLPWQWGARFFQQHLIDFDVASNNHGWQWVAGTGTDAAPYYRIFNPESQRQRFDADGSYVSRWVGDGYGAPIVDHATERLEALARLDEL